ncbi:MAG TPA: TRAP transporter small permease subunit [Azospirillum sp.]
MSSAIERASAGARPAPVRRALFRASAAVARVERVAACALIAAVAGLILLNVFTRAFNVALYWVDEAAIYAMVWATLVAASLTLRKRGLIAVTLLLDAAGPRVRRAMTVLNDAIILAFSGYLIWLCWIWFAPLEFARAGFDVGAFVVATGNFLYGEPTLTIGIPKVWVWLIMPVFAVTLTVHALANLAESLADGAPPPAPTTLD